MSYLVLARKYRPQGFSQMVGQEHVVRVLRNALSAKRLHHGYFFTGTRGVGKTTVSRILARALNCTGPDGQGDVTPEPCGVCEACQAITAGRFVDYTELDAASNRGVAEMQTLLEQAVYKPVLGRFKIFMIDEVHMLSTHAFNALLKTLEEPPEYLKFVLATTDAQKVPITVLSRCLQFNLRSMPQDILAAQLRKVLEQEQIVFDAPALLRLARAARGSMRDALSIADRAIAYGAGSVTDTAVKSMLGEVDGGTALAMLQALADRDSAGLLGHIDALRQESASAASLLEEMLGYLQQVAVAQWTLPDAEANQTSSLPQQEQAALQTLAEQLSKDEVQFLYSIVLQGRQDLGWAPDEYAALMMVLLRFWAFCEPQRLPSSALPHSAAADEKKNVDPIAAAPVAVAVAVPVCANPVAPLSERAATPAADLSAVPQLQLLEVREMSQASSHLERRISAEAPAQAHRQWLQWLGERVHVANLQGMVRELALQAQCLEWTQRHMRLRVEQQVLASSAVQTKLQNWLQQQGLDLALIVEWGPVEDSLARQHRITLEARRKAARQQMENDPFVQKLQRDFAARWVASKFVLHEESAAKPPPSTHSPSLASSLSHKGK